MTKKINKDIDVIQPGMKITLEIHPQNNNGEKTNILSLSSMVEAILDDDCMLIHMPMYQGYYYSLHADEVLVLHCFLDPTMYEQTVQFQEQVSEDNLLYAKVLRVGEIRSYQRRNCYRLPCSFPVTIEPVPDQVSDTKPQPFVGQTINFSDSGMLFATNAKLEEGKTITLTFHIGRIETVEAFVFRVSPNTGLVYQYNAAVQFLNSDSDVFQKDRFYKYIVEKQLEERRRHAQ